MDSEPSPGTEHTFVVTDGPVSRTILRALTTVYDGDETEMKPLYDVIDPDALDDLFRGQNPGTVTFEYEGYTVVVRESAEVVIRE